MQKLEKNLKERERALGRKTLYRSIQPTLYDYSFFRDFPLTRYLLGLAERLYPEDPQVALLLAEEYRTIGDREKAISYYEKAKRQLEKLTPQEKHRIYLRLGGLYFEEKAYPQARENLEKLYKEVSSLSSQEKSQLLSILAKLYAKHIGNPKKTTQYLKEYLEILEQEKSQIPSEEGKILKEKIWSLYELGKNAYATFSKEEALYYLQKAREEIHRFLRLIQEVYDKKRAIEKELNQYKLRLRKETTQEDLSRYYTLQSDLKYYEGELSLLEGLKKRMPIKEFYLFFATFYEREKAIYEAISLLEEGEKAGISPTELRRYKEELKRKY